ncbi:MAG: alpha/beta hydrolase [Methanomethylophilus sp.]|nr:alpha/beta hydrolase [Methanomethylophilus sp.]
MSEGLNRNEDCPYIEDGSNSHCLDVYWPRGIPGPLPVAIHFHGGAFIAGDRTKSREYCQLLALRGFAVFNVDFRIVDGRTVTLREIVTDATDAMYWIAAHCTDYGADCRKVFLTGTSSGANLAVWSALIANGTRLPAALELKPPPFRVIGIGCHSGIFQIRDGTLRMWAVRHLIFRPGERQGPVAQALDFWSNHDLNSLPPVFLDTSDDDFMQNMTDRFAELLTVNRVPHRVMTFDTSSHGKLVHAFAATHPELPESVRAMSAMVLYFREALSDPAFSARTSS